VNLSRLWPLAAFIVLSAVFILAGLWLRAIYAPEWMLLDTSHQPPDVRPWAVEADCYSQLARVQRILHGQGLIQNHFTVENWPEGLVPSTTAPFDYVILLFYAPLTLFTKYPLDWAGAIVSPALWLGLVLFMMIFRSREFTLSGRTLFVIGSALLPALIWATAFGRPRHQSLILVLMAMGLVAEYERWQIELTPKRAWNIFAGIVWGLACWTSLFEPMIVVFALITFNLIARRRENLAFLVSFGVVIVAMIGVEGDHIFTNLYNIYDLTPENRAYSLNWLSTIAEVQPMTLSGFVQQCTSLSFIVILPFVAWRLLRESGSRKTDLLLVLLTVLLALLTFAQKRWIYYANLTELLVIVRYFQVAPTRWPRVLIVVLFLLGALYDDRVQISARLYTAAAQPSLDSARIARSIDGTGGIMAPWWISPGLLYFSGQPIVSGSSHSGITGIVASAQFFSATSWADAERILKERKVRWIVAWDDQTVYNGEQYVYPLLNNSRQILGLPSYSDDDKAVAERTVAQVLVEDSDVPTWIRLRNVTPQLKLYEYVPDTR
jgi:hypothetical protein